MLYFINIFESLLKFLKREDNWITYDSITQLFGEVIIDVTDSDYQGDTRLLIKRHGKYGILIFGWGSCSGCDALEGCSSDQDYYDLISSLENDIKLFETLDQAKEWVSNDMERELSYYYHIEEWNDFKKKVLALK
jgi:hypothetical protein